MISQIVGNITAGAVLKSGAEQSTLFIVFAVLSVVGSLTFLFLSDTSELTKQEEPKKDDDSFQQTDTSPCDDINATFQMLKSPRMLMVLPLITWTAFSMCIFSSIFFLLMKRSFPEGTDENVANYKAFFVMVLLGVGEILGGQLIAYVKDKTGDKTPFIINIFQTVIAYVFLIAYNERNKFDWLVYVMVFLWGI